MRVIGRNHVPEMPDRILITGASGFVGRHLTATLATAFPGVTLCTPRFDVTDFAATADAVRIASPDSCVHLAAISTIAAANENQSLTWQVNLHGTLHLAHALLRHAPDCQLIYASTTEAYGASFRDAAMLDETAPLAPLNLYAATKAAADLALGALIGNGLRLVRPRPVNHTGPGQRMQFVVPAFARQVARIAAGKQAPVIDVGNLEPMRDFLDVRDVCWAYVACMTQKDALKPGAILNIASGMPRRIGDILEVLKEIAGVTAETRVDTTRARANDVPTACGNATRARELLGWKPAIPWRQTLRDVLDEWRDKIEIGMG